MAVLAAHLAGGLAWAGPPSAPQDVRDFAPIVWLSPDESTYPMLPHPFAFDGIDNNDNGSFDTEDVDEVGMGWYELRQAEKAALRCGLLAPGTHFPTCPNTTWPKDLPAECGKLRCWTTKGRPWGDPGAPEVEAQRRVLYSFPELFAAQLDVSTTTTVRDLARKLLDVDDADLAGLEDVSGWELREREVEPAPRRRPGAGPGRDTSVALWVGPRELRQVLAAPMGSVRPREPDQVLLYQYWFYYPYDEGPNGHPHDGEHVSIFVRRESGPTSPAAVRQEQRQHGRLIGVVGAGHLPHNVNNILVTGTAGSDAILPKDLRRHMPVLVELGKHASAPDRNCNGRFDLGFDANLYPEAVWGSRDVWSGNVGQALKVGDFHEWYSYARDAQDLLLEEGWTSDSGYREVCAGFDGRVENILKERGVDKNDQKHLYQLFPIALLQKLDRLVAAGSAEALTEFLWERRASFWAGREPSRKLVVTNDVLGAMVEWSKGKNPDRLQVWRHEAFRKPDHVFRPWLFGPFGIGLSTRVDAGNLVTGAVVRVAEIRVPGWIPGIGGGQALHDSRVELYAHADGLRKDMDICGDHACLYDAGIDVFAGRGRFGGLYFGGAWNRSFRAKSNWNKLGASAGIEFGLPSFEFLGRKSSAMFSIGASAQLFRDSPKVTAATDTSQPPDASARDVSPVRAHLGLRIIWGLRSPRHPLTY